MSRPRKPYGPNPPGRLSGTMIKVLAAEMSDQGRLARGKRYWSDDAVVDIVVGHGAVTAEVLGSRPQPYVVTIEANAGTGIPAKREVWAQCTCPDDTGTGVDLCKHAVAAFFALADEVTIDPELIDRWRHSARRRPDATDPADAEVTRLPSLEDRLADHGGDRGDDGDGDDESADDEVDGDDVDAGSGDDGSGGDDDGRGADVLEFRPRVDPELGAIARLLGAPDGASAPRFPEVADLEHGTIRARLLAEVLDDALDHLAIRWE